MKIYTKTGDAGETGLPGGIRLPKDAGVPECCGTVDELNSTLGLVRACTLPADIDQLLQRIQSQLFDLGAEVARQGAASQGMPTIGPEHIRIMEEAIDRYDAELPQLTNFILPGGTPAAAGLHFARTVCRRAERRLVTLRREVPALSPQLVIYLNRLSDLLFVLARVVNARAGQPETIWRRGS